MTDQPDEGSDDDTEPVEPTKFEVVEPQYDLFEKGQKTPPFDASAEGGAVRPDQSDASDA